MDTEINTVEIYTKESDGTYPSLTRTNLLTDQGLYEFKLCTYTKTTTSVTLNSTNYRSMIKKDSLRVSEVEYELKSRSRPRRLQIQKISNGVYEFHETSSSELSESIVYVTINNSVIINFPGDTLFIFIGSNNSIAYRYGGADYSLGVVYENERVTLTVGNTTHNITSVYIKK
ncbi:MAG: hypothetical protein WC154_00285 [Candidatus Izemoplasmatales bacterium]